MKRSSKTSPVQIIDFADFSGGLNLRDSPENIAVNELSECLNMAYAKEPGRLTTRGGLASALWTLQAPANGLLAASGGLLAASGGHLYLLEYDGNKVTDKGALTGAEPPAFCRWENDVYIATGGKLQKYSDGTLSAVPDSPDRVSGVYARMGRLFAWNTGSDTLRGSAVGDPLKWGLPSGTATDADPIEIQIGYKVAGNIVGAVPGLRDVIFFKTSGIFRLVGEYPNWTIAEITRDDSLVNKSSVAEIDGLVYYLAKGKGLRLLQGSQGYEQILPADAMSRVADWISGRLNGALARLMPVKGEGFVIVAPDTSPRVLTAWRKPGMPALMWQFPETVHAACETDDGSVYIACGKSVYKYYPNVFNDAGSKIETKFVTKKIIGFSNFLLKRLKILLSRLKEDKTAELKIYCNGVLLLSINGANVELGVYIYGDNRIIYGLDKYMDDDNVEINRQDYNVHDTLRTSAIVIEFSGNMPYQLINFSAEITPVGVIA